MLSCIRTPIRLVRWGATSAADAIIDAHGRSCLGCLEEEEETNLSPAVQYVGLQMSIPTRSAVCCRSHTVTLLPLALVAPWAKAWGHQGATKAWAKVNSWVKPWAKPWGLVVR